jgi:5-dehydro-2-deoxygluconokinase
MVMGSVMVEITPVREGEALRDAGTLLPLPSGAATNFALSAARLGVSTGMISRVGDDEWGEWLRARLVELGLDVRHVEARPGEYSPVSFCWMDRRGAKTFYFYRFPGFCDPLAAVGPEDVTPGWFEGCRCFDFTEATIRREPLRSAAFAAAELARGLGLKVVYAVNYRESGWAGREAELVETQLRACQVADVAVMNAKEAAMLTGLGDPAEAAAEIGALGPEVVAVTAGEEGSVVWHDGRAEVIPPFEAEVLYDIGAGDTYHAGLVAGLLRGLPEVDAARLAGAAAALKIGRPPTLDQLPTWEEAAAVAGV